MTGSPFLAVRPFNGAHCSSASFIRPCVVSASSVPALLASSHLPMVLSTALAVACVALPSPSHVDQASSSRIAGMRGSSSWDLIVRRMSSLAGTVA
jgi:hypothetical protein